MATKSEICRDIGDRLEGLFERAKPWPLHEPEFGSIDEDLVIDCIRSGWVSSVGKYVDQFEAEVAKTVNAKYAVAVVNGTAALHLALIAAGVGPDSEVLLPNLTFIATANAVKMAHAVPHLVDSCCETLGLDIDKLRNYLCNDEYFLRESGVLVNRKTNRKVSAILPVHILGHPVEMDDLLSLANDFSLAVIEDAAESLGSYYKGRHTGTLGQIGCFSFNGNKILTTGGGGVLVTDQKSLAEKIKHLSTTAKTAHRWDFIHDEAGYNYRLPNLNAALGVAQLSVLDDRILRKRKIAGIYRKAFEGCEYGSMFRELDGNRANSWLNAFILNEGFSSARDDILDSLCESGVYVRPFWRLLHSQTPYADCPRMEDLTGSVSLCDRTICFPSSSTLLS